MLIVFNYKRVTYPLSHHNITLNKIDGVNIEPNLETVSGCKEKKTSTFN